MDMKLELVVLPVTDVDRAKAFYEQAGFRLDVDHRAGDEFRVVQLTPPGSACSITIGVGVSQASPGRRQGLHLVVTDLPAVSPSSPDVASRSANRSTSAPRDRRPASTRSDRTTARTPRSAIPTATAGCCRRCRHRCAEGVALGQAGHGGQQGLGVGVRRIVEHVGRRAALDDEAVAQHDHVVAEVADDAEVVGDEDEAQLVLVGAGHAAGRGSARAPRRRVR